MRIAMIGQKRTGSREGGVEVVVTELATRMAALGHEVTCFDRSGTDVNGDPTPSEPYEYRGVRVVPVRTVDVKGLAALTSAYAATRAALKDRPDVIHYHAEGPCNALPLAARMDVRTVATVHGLDWQRAKWGGLASRVIRRGERMAAQRADALIVLSEPVRRYFREEY
ncbi:glycosyltransferase [Collinsella tanakaei]|nr:glycosyltransferase [Collinsella tanakaei]